MLRLIAGLAAVAGAAPVQAAQTSSSASAFSTTLEPGRPYEACMSLQAGDSRRYYWKADAPVDFEIAARDASDAAPLVKRPRMRGDGGSFVAKSAGDYCWRWSGPKPAKVEGKIEPGTQSQAPKN